MTPKDIFGIIVRITGLISLLYFVMFSLSLGMFSLSPRFVIICLIWLGASVWLLKGARALVELAYRDD